MLDRATIPAQCSVAVKLGRGARAAPAAFSNAKAAHSRAHKTRTAKVQISNWASGYLYPNAGVADK